MRKEHYPTYYDTPPLEVKLDTQNVAFVAEDVGEKCTNSFLVVLTASTGLRTQPRLIRFNFDATTERWGIASENVVGPLDKVDKVFKAWVVD